MMNKKLFKRFEKLAKAYVCIDTLEPQNRDCFDFHDVGVRSLTYTITFKDRSVTCVGSRSEAEMEILLANDHGIKVDHVVDSNGKIWYCEWTVTLNQLGAK